MTDYKKSSSLLIIVLINLLFLIKYVERVTDYYLILTLLISVGYYLIYRFRNCFHTSEIIKKQLFYGVILCYIGLSVYLFYKIPQSSLNVDRYSVITSFWDSFFHSNYVYTSRSHQGNLPGPMPFYFILAFPFYLVHELGYFSLMGLVVFAAILTYSKRPINNQLSGLFLLACSAFYGWETLSRSNIFLNASLILGSCIFFMNTLTLERKKHIVLHGVIIGLLLSTRNVLILPYIVLFLYVLKNRLYTIREVFQIGLLVIITFALTFLPFVINHFQSFLEINPFIIQSSYLIPSWLSLICILLTFSSYFFLKQKEDVFFYGGLFLFITVLIYFIYQIQKHGFINTLFGSQADLSYFILCVPFFLYYLTNAENRIFRYT
jgi:hypothetical protein